MLFFKSCALFALVLSEAATLAGAGIADVPFDQECHVAHPFVSLESANDVRAVVVDDAGTVHAATNQGCSPCAKTSGQGSQGSQRAQASARSNNEE